MDTTTTDELKERKTTKSNVQIPKPDVVWVNKLLYNNEDLCIPSYQRPYRWKAAKHVRQLLEDLHRESHKSVSEYRIGTIILHETKADKILEIVDGQQRLLTLSLLCLALGKEEGLSLLLKEFSHQDTKNNLRYNFNYIKRYLDAFDEKDRKRLYQFIIEKCTVVVIKLTDISEAFQLFDSQNARGKSLKPVDLLKAYHLRLLDEQEANLKLKLVSTWEHNIDKNNLNNILGEYIFRLRYWLRKDWEYYFSKDKIEEFKGINLVDSIKKGQFYPYMRTALVNSQNVNFQVNELVINGQRFFEFTAHYVEVFQRLNKFIQSDEMKGLFSYRGSHRPGDKSLKNLYLIILMFYYDKFGQDINFIPFAKELYRWVYTERLRKKRISFQTIINLLKNNGNSPLRQLQKWYYPDILALRTSISKINESDEKDLVKNGKAIEKFIIDIQNPNKAKHLI